LNYLILSLAVLFSACAHPGKTSVRDQKSAAKSLHLARTGPSAPAKHSTRVVRTTAYSHMEDGNRKNALGQQLTCGSTYSASADWSRYPAGTIFRMAHNGRTYIVDDYGSALVGTDTIDLYVPSLREMHQWGVRNVQINVLKMGNFADSLATLRPRTRTAYVRRMVRDLETKVF